MEHSESIVEITKALCAFHKDVGKILKEADNPFYKSKYATLSNILRVINKPLTDNGLNIVQMMDDKYGLTTMLSHTSGEFIKATSIMTPQDNKPQTVGSCVTYHRRYTICAILNLNIEDDDDGNAASGVGQTKQPTQAKQPTQVRQQPASKEKKKRVLTMETIDNDKFLGWLYDKEKKCRETGVAFGIKRAVEEDCIATENIMNAIVNKYSDYKINNNLL